MAGEEEQLVQTGSIAVMLMLTVSINSLTLSKSKYLLVVALVKAAAPVDTS